MYKRQPFLLNDWYRYVRTDLDFHADLVRAADSKRLTRLYAASSSEIMLCLCQSRNTLILNPKNIYEHRRFIEVLNSGDVDEAVKLVHNHIVFGIENIARGFHTGESAE